MSKKAPVAQGSFVTSTKELFYKTLGKVETTEDSEEFKQGNEEYKATQTHLKNISTLNKKYQTSCQNFSSVETNIAQELINYAQTVYYDTKGKQIEDPFEKSKSELSLVLQTMGATLEYISTSRQKMATEIQEGFFENVSDLVKDIERCEETKKNYKQFKLE
jgi:DNA repair ATPase RecN